MTTTPRVAVGWEAVQDFLGTDEFHRDKVGDPPRPNPEGIVHELCHAWDCRGRAALRGPIGGQASASEMIAERYAMQWHADLSEVRVTALTYLVLEPFGLCDVWQQVHDMAGNVCGPDRSLWQRHGKAGLTSMFFDECGKRRTVAHAAALRAWLTQRRFSP